LAIFKEEKVIKDMDREGGSIYFIDKRTQIFQEFDKTFSKLLKIK